MSRLRCVVPLVTAFFLLIAAGCGGGASSNNTGSSSGSNGGSGSGGSGGGSTAPTVTNFAVSPMIAAAGEFVNFSWATSNATSFKVMPNIAQDDQTLPLSSTGFLFNTNGLTSTTTFQAVATSGSTNSQAKSATLTIVPMTLTASPSTIQSGQTVTLTFSGPNNGSSWSVLNVTTNTATNIPAPSCSGNTCSGTYTTPPLSSNTTFQVIAAINGGQAYSPQAVVTVENPTTITFTANPTTVPPGGAVTLSWVTTNATSVSIDQGVGQVAPPLNVNMGSYCCVHPEHTTTYTATATSQFPDSPPAMASATVTVSTGGISNLNHIIFMLQENRSFDNYFGVLAQYRVNHNPPIQGAQLSDVNDLHNLPSGYQICNAQHQCFPPFHARTECIENLSPSWDETHYDMDLVGNDWLNLTQSSQYLMDRFLDTTLSGGSGDRYDPTHSRPLGYYDQTDLPFYYELATQFTTSDTWYSPEPANTVPNRMYLFAATSYGHAFPPHSGDPAWQRPTIFRALTQAGISWRYYYQDNSVFLANWADWNDPQIQANVRNIQEYYNILASPNADQQLPQVVFIERASATGYDEHPDNNVQKGAARVQQIINALLNSAAWPDSAFILTFDEGGGLYEQQGPILVTPPDDLTPQDLGAHDTRGLFNVTGFRVPVVVVSPWARPQTISHLQTDYTSILKLIETRFNVPPLTQRDATTQDMTDPTNGFFDFSSPHLLTVPPLPTQPTNGTCDFHLEGAP